MTTELKSLSISAWQVGKENTKCLLPFNTAPFANAGQLSGNTPFIIYVNQKPFLAFKRHHSLVIPAISLSVLAILLNNLNKVKPVLIAKGIKTLVLNTINANNEPEVIANAINNNTTIRYEYMVNLAHYQRSKLSSNHKRNIKKAEQAKLLTKEVSSIEAINQHIAIVNNNLTGKGIDGVTSPIEYFQMLISQGAGKLIQVFDQQTVIASTFFLIDQGCAYYHSSGTNEQGKATGAAYFLVDHCVESFKKYGLESINLGGCTTEQTGLIRFKQGFNAQPRLLLSAQRKLLSSWKQKLRSLFTVKAGDILQVDAVFNYLKPLTTIDDDIIKLTALDFNHLFREAINYPELSRSLAIFCRPSPHCYALYNKNKIAAICFIETHEQNQLSVKNVHSLPKGSAEITHVYVLNHAKNKGMGKTLIKSAEKIVRNMDFSHAYVRVSADNEISQKLFAATHYKKTSTQRLVSTRLFGGRSFILNG